MEKTAPDLILHGGDLADGGASPSEIVDRVRDLGWQGVAGNTDEMLWNPDSLTEVANQSPKLKLLFDVIRELATATRESLGEERLTWLRDLPRVQVYGQMALVHASPDSLWHAPTLESSAAELEQVYAPLGKPIAVYAHIHRSYIRSVSGSWTKSSDCSPVADFPIPIGLQKCSNALPSGCPRRNMTPLVMYQAVCCGTRRTIV